MDEFSFSNLIADDNWTGCSLCGTHYDSNAVRQTHMATNHMVPYPYHCPKCNTVFSNDLTLRKHISGARYSPCYNYHRNQEGDVVCFICNYKTEETSDMIIHMKIHFVDQPYMCKCGIAFCQLQELSFHSRNCEISQTFLNQHLTNEENRDPQTYSDETNLNNEMQSEVLHVELVKNNIDEGQNILGTVSTTSANQICSLPTINEVSRIQLQNLMKCRQTSRFICKTCGLRCESSKALSDHQKLHPIKPFSCSECEIKFKSKKSLYQHKRLIHNPKKLTCKECGQSFKQEKYLRVHMKNVEKKKRDENFQSILKECNML